MRCSLPLVPSALQLAHPEGMISILGVNQWVYKKKKKKLEQTSAPLLDALPSLVELSWFAGLRPADNVRLSTCASRPRVSHTCNCTSGRGAKFRFLTAIYSYVSSCTALKSHL